MSEKMTRGSLGSECSSTESQSNHHSSVEKMISFSENATENDFYGMNK